MIRAGKGGRVGARPGGGHGRMNKTIPCGCGFPYGGIFFMWAVFSLHVEAIFSVCCGGYFLVCPPPLEFFFAGTPM